MIDFDKYDPKCECGWRLVDDVFYQVKDKMVYELEYNVETHSPIPKFSDLPVYPKYDSKDNIWTETHFCPQCEKEYTYDIPEEEDAPYNPSEDKTYWLDRIISFIRENDPVSGMEKLYSGDAYSPSVQPLVNELCDLHTYISMLLCKVNKVTAYHRHGQKIPEGALDDLSNFQIDFEDFLERDK